MLKITSPTSVANLLELFPAGAQQIVREAISLSVDGIPVGPMTDSDREYYGTAAKFVMLDMCEQRDKIALPNQDVALHCIFHEVLHLHRYRVHNIPKLIGNAGPRAFMLECTLEHRRIVPIEMEMFPADAPSYWRRDLSEALTNGRSASDERDQRFGLVSGWLLSRVLFSSEEIFRQYEAALDEFHFRDFAESMLAHLEKTPPNKNHEIAICTEMFELKRSTLEVWTYGRAGTSLAKGVVTDI